MQSAEPTSRRRGRPVKNKNINKIRTFKMPTPNYDANSFQDMIVEGGETRFWTHLTIFRRSFVFHTYILSHDGYNLVEEEAYLTFIS